ATLRDFTINHDLGTGIRVENCDQPSGRVFADQLNAGGGARGKRGEIAVLVDRVDRSDVLLRNFQGGRSCDTWVKVIGRDSAQAAQGGLKAKAPAGQTSIFCGAASACGETYAVEHGGRLVVRSV